MIVWALPLSIGVSSLPVPPCTGLNLSTVRSKNSSAVEVVAPAAMTTITSAPMKDFLSNAQVGLHLFRDPPDEVDEGAAVTLQRGDGDPFGGAVVASSDGTELDGGHAGVDEADRVRGAVAADTDRLGVEHAGHAFAQHPYEPVVAIDDRGVAVELGHQRDGGKLGDLVADVRRVLPRQIPDVDVDEAAVGDLVEGVAAEDAPEVDRGPVEQVRA